MLRFLWFLALAAMAGVASAQFIGTAPTRDGTIASNEYGNHSSGSNAQPNGSTTWYLTWDATTLYVAVDGGFNPGNDAVVLYLDTNPAEPVNNSANGAIAGTGFDGVTPYLPLAADVFLFVKNGYNAISSWDGAAWTTVNNPLATVFTDGNTTEFAVTFSQLGLVARPSAFNFLGMVTFSSGAFAEVPTANNATGGNSTLYYYYTVSSTDDGAATPPFSQLSFTQHNTTSFSYTSSLPTTLWDFTVYDNQPDGNADNTTATGGGCTSTPCENQPNRVMVFDNLTINNALYVGAGSAIFPDFVRTPTITLSGSAPSIYNAGRLECVPDIAARTTRRLDFSFLTGTTTLAATALDKSLYRFANIYIGNGAAVLAPASGSASVELEYGTLTNDGTLNLVNGSGYVDVGLRGGYAGTPLSVTNDYYFQNGAFAVGTFQLHNLLIGQDASRLQPTNTATNPVVTLKVAGNFENYHEFLAQNGSGQLAVEMNGTDYQEFRGTIGETVGNTTRFHSLTINNDNGLANDNSGADVGFLSYGGSSIVYEISGQLVLTKGDLRTRNGSTTHQLILKSGATLNDDGAQSHQGALTSCFVDGPLTLEVASASPATLHFPVGKSSGASADYRPVSLAVTMDAATATQFTAEVFTTAAPANADAAAVAPDPAILATQILNYHYWTVSKGSGANVATAQITLTYSEDEYSDQVTDATALRLLKDDGAGNWINLSPGVGGTADGDGTITSIAFNTFSDFALADLNLPLAVAAVVLDVRREADGSRRLFWGENLAATDSFAAFRVEKAATAQHPFAEVGVWPGDVVSCPVGQLSAPALFRVQGITLNGASVYSNTVVVQPEAQGWYVWQPNGQQAWLSGGFPLEPDSRYQLFDMAGRCLAEKEITTTPVQVLSEGLAAGTYLLCVVRAGTVQAFKLQVQP